MSFIAVSEAARRLGVSTRQVQQLVSSGAVVKVARGVIDETSVDRLLAVRGTSHGRAWSEETAWAAIALLSGANAGWVGERQRSRLKARLRVLSAVGLVERTRDRAETSRYRAHSSGTGRLRSEVVHARVAARALGLATTDVSIDGYVTAVEVPRLVSRHGLVLDSEGRVTLRATNMSLDIVRDLADRDVVLTALDLSESLDVRERRVGLRGLTRALETFR